MSKQQTYDKVDLLGVSVDVVFLAEAIQYIVEYCADKSRPAGYVIKPYVEFLDRASRNPELEELLNGAELSVADGVAVIWAAHYLYAGPRTIARFLLTLTQIIAAPAKLNWPLPERAAGTNFTWPLLQAAADRKLRVFLIGKDSAEAVQRTASAIQRQIPTIIIVGTRSGYDPASAPGSVSAAWIAETADQLRVMSVDLVLVGMGFPLQEQVCAQLAATLTHGLLIGEGGTFDYESFGGIRPKAPENVQKFGLEWLWRLVQEPHRIVRQLAIPRFMYKIWLSRK